MRSTLARLAPALVALVMLGCQTDTVSVPAGPPLTPDTSINTNATVRYIDIEGGCWVLETTKGKYQPINLPAQFQIDGLRVYVEFKGAPTIVSICMVAPLVAIERIEAGR